MAVAPAAAYPLEVARVGAFLQPQEAVRVAAWLSEVVRAVPDLQLQAVGRVAGITQPLGVDRVVLDQWQLEVARVGSGHKAGRAVSVREIGSHPLSPLAVPSMPRLSYAYFPVMAC